MLHNPDKLTAEQIETDKGYRLLEDFEIQPDSAFSKIEIWDEYGVWHPCTRGQNKNFTYRTKLSPRDLHALRSNCGQVSLPQREALQSEPKGKTITYVTLPTWFVYFMAISTTLAFAILSYLLSHL